MAAFLIAFLLIFISSAMLPRRRLIILVIGMFNGTMPLFSQVRQNAQQVQKQIYYVQVEL